MEQAAITSKTKIDAEERMNCTVKMKTPRRQARQSLTARKGTISPGWISGKDKIFSPKSPSPVRRTTRRSSVYQSKAARSDIAKFKMPAAVKSPPGAKTRARRSSIYQKGGQKPLSPRNLPVSSRTRRSSIYMRGTNVDTEFSKVFRTPIKPLEPVKTIVEENDMTAAKITKNTPKPAVKTIVHSSPSPTLQRKRSPSKSKMKSPSPTLQRKRSPSKSKMKSPSPTLQRKRSPSKSKMKSPSPTLQRKRSPSKSKMKSPSPTLQRKRSPSKSKMKSPSPTLQRKRSPSKSKMKSPSPSLQGKRSPSKSKMKSPFVTISPLKEIASPVSLKKTPANKLKFPKVTKSAKKTPKSVVSAAVKTPVSENKSPGQEKSPKQTKSSRKSAKKSVQTPAEVKKLAKKSHVTYTPSKTVEEITNKSFYGTPQETITRNDDLIVFSAKPVSAVKTRQRKITLSTPKVKSAKSTPKRMPTRKTPAVKRQLPESDDDSTPIEMKRKVEKEGKSSRKKVIMREHKIERDTDIKELEMNESEKEIQKTNLKLSPEEMISVLKSVHEEERLEKRKAEEEIDQRPSKIARLTGYDITTPRLRKMAKRASPKKLAEIAEKKDMLREEWVSEADSTILNDTFNTDSRSSRCIIL